MVISTSQQVMLVLFSIISGIITGVFFDLYRLMRNIQDPNNVITFIEDILFWILTAILVFIFLSVNDYAYIGAYVYLCIVLGLACYFSFLSSIFTTVSCKVINAAGKFLRISKNIIFFPFEILIDYIRKHKEIKKKP